MLGRALVASLIFTSATHAQSSASRRLGAVLDTIQHGLRATAFETQIAGGAAPAALPDVSRGAWEADAATWRRIRAAARAIPEAQLDAEERITRSLVLWESSMQGAHAPHWWVDFSSITPYASPIGYVARAFGSLPLQSTADTTAYLRLLREVAPLIDSIRAGLEQREARGIRLSRQAIEGSVGLVRAYATRGSGNPFGVPTVRCASLDSSTRAAFSGAVARITDEAIAPAADRLIALLEGPYATRAPAGVGLGQYPGGAAYYRWLVQWHTTRSTSAAALHQTGLREVARIEREMGAIRREVGFAGTLDEFKRSLAKDARFFARTPEEVGERLMGYARRLDPLLDTQFARRPRAKGDVRRLPLALEPSMTFGYYQVPTVADSIGHYFYNGTKLEERSLLTAAPLIAHELWPGHHFQVNLARENASLPRYRRERYYTAYGEGWGDYASIVAGELGLYSDPYDRFGRLAMDMFISCRLVVDTGMHAFGWSRERAMAFMRAHAMESETQIRSETLRYSTDLPGQALAYKSGSLAFERLRAQYRVRMGSRYDPREFHARVLDHGMLPMTLLERVVLGSAGSAGR
jgi:uncharacterized protein (DUF885 family)